MKWSLYTCATLCLFLTSSTVYFQANEEPKLKTLTFRLQSEPETLDWNRAHTPLETYLLMNLMEGLLRLDSKLQITPGLAESWSVSADQKTYTFHLKPKVQWSDGSTLKAEDFVYSWKRLLSPETAAAYAYFLYDIEGAKDFNQGKTKSFNQVRISAPDPLTLQVKLTHPVSYWPFITTFWVTFPLRKEVVERPGPRWDTQTHLVTLGPYLLDRHEFGTRFVLKANPNYHGKKGNVEQLIGQIVENDATALSLYEAGLIDFLSDISTIDLKRLENRKDLKAFPYLKTVYLGFVLNQKSVKDLALRQAIARAIDKTQFSRILRGKQEGADSLLPPPLRHFDSVRTSSQIDSIQTKTLKLAMTLPSTDKAQLVGQVLQAALKKNLGIDLELQSWDNKAYRAQLDQKTNPLFLASWSADYPDPDNFFSIFMGDSGNNRTTWKSSAFDEMVLRARYETKTSEKDRIYQKLDELLTQQDVVIVPLYYEPNLTLIRARVKNLDLNPLNYLNLRDVNLD